MTDLIVNEEDWESDMTWELLSGKAFTVFVQVRVQLRGAMEYL